VPTRSREKRLACPRGAPVATDFQLAELELPDPAEGRFPVQFIWLVEGGNLGKMLVRVRPEP
jgi:NADPH-dependent curcumin reductase CurA